MENLTNTAVHLLEDSQGADLTRREKRKLSVEITTAMIALVCLVTGLLYKGIFPEQTAVAGLIYSVGVLVEGLPPAGDRHPGLSPAGRDQRHGDPGLHRRAGLLHHWAARAGHPGSQWCSAWSTFWRSGASWEAGTPSRALSRCRPPTRCWKLRMGR